MKAVIARASDGWSSTGFIALMEGEAVVMARSAKELMIQLQALGASEHSLVFSGSDDGDRYLSTDQIDELSVLTTKSCLPDAETLPLGGRKVRHYRTAVDVCGTKRSLRRNF